MVSVISAGTARRNLGKIVSDLGLNFNDETVGQTWKDRFWALVKSNLRGPMSLVPTGLHFNHSAVREMLGSNAASGPRAAPEIDIDHLSERYRGACSLIETILPEFLEILQLLGISIHVISHQRAAPESGSNFAMPGFFFVAVSKDATDESIAELVVHELTHNWLFFEEIANGLFSNDVYSRTTDVAVASPFRKLSRRFDQSFHALCVAIVTSEFRIRAKMPALSTEVSIAKVIDDLRATINSSQSAGRPILTSRGAHILDELAASHSEKTS